MYLNLWNDFRPNVPRYGGSAVKNLSEGPPRVAVLVEVKIARRLEEENARD